MVRDGEGRIGSEGERENGVRCGLGGVRGVSGEAVVVMVVRDANHEKFS